MLLSMMAIIAIEGEGGAAISEGIIDRKGYVISGDITNFVVGNITGVEGVDMRGIVTKSISGETVAVAGN